MNQEESKKRKQDFDDFQPNKKRKSVSFAKAVHYFEDELEKEELENEDKEDYKDEDVINQENPLKKEKIHDFSIEEISLEMKMDEGTNKNVSTSITTIQTKEIISKNEQSDTIKRLESIVSKKTVEVNEEKRKSNVSEMNDVEDMDFTSTIPPMEQFNDEMEMTYVLPVKENLTPEKIDINQSKSSDIRDMQLTEEVNTLLQKEEDKSLLPILHSFDKTADTDGDFQNNLSYHEIIKENETLLDNTDDFLSSISQDTNLLNKEIDIEVKKNRYSGIQNRSQSRHGLRASTTSNQTYEPNESNIVDIFKNKKSDEFSDFISNRTSITSINESRLSLLDNSQSYTLKNLTVDEFLRLTNIRLGLSAGYGMKPRTSMYIPSENDQHPLTYEEKVHLQSVTPIYYSVIQDACEELKKMSIAAERQLSQLSHQINQNNPPIFKFVQQLTHGSNEYRSLRQQLTNLKSFARAKNRYEFIKWKIELEKKKFELIHEEQKRLLEDQHAIEYEIKRVRSLTAKQEEEFDRLQKIKGKLQRKLDISSDTTKNPSQGQTLGFMEMMTKNIHTEMLPPNRCRLSYPSLNFSLDIIFKIGEKSNAPITKYESSTSYFTPSITKDSNPYREFCSYSLNMIPIQSIFEGAKKAAEFRSVFSVKLHPLLNRLNRIVTTMLEYRKKNPIIQFQFPKQSPLLKENSLVNFRLVFIHHRKIARLVLEYTISTKTMQLSTYPKIVEYYLNDQKAISKLEEEQKECFDRSFRFERLEKSIDCILQYLYITDTA